MKKHTRRGIIWLLTLLLFACKNNEPGSTTRKDTLVTHADTTHTVKKVKPETLTPKTYSNERFREVTVERISENKFRIQGKGQIFEANFNWSIEDGHEELKSGFQMTDAGAPQWGKFDFTIDIQKKRDNSTLNLILFESSAKDGSRQHELPMVLY